MNFWLKNRFKDRKGKFSREWFEIFQTRFALCVVLSVFIYSSNVAPKEIIASLIILYLIINIAFGLFNSDALRVKSIRLITEYVDIIFTSALIYFTGGEQSSLFLLYLFPIISVSRFLSYEGTIPVMVLTIIAYLIVALPFSPDTSLRRLILKCLVLVGVSFVVGNLTRERRHNERELIESLNEVNNPILSNAETKVVLETILEKAKKLTDSDSGQIKVLNDDSKFARTSVTGGLEIYEWNTNSLAERYYEKVITSKKSVCIFFMKRGEERDTELPNYFHDIWNLTPILLASIDDTRHIPGSALIVPLILDDKVIGIISLFSKHFAHYAPNDSIKLESFAQLLGIALKNSDMYREKTERLKMLHEIGEQLKVEQGLKDIFQNVVELTYKQLNSEESALFIWDEETKLIKKRAVKAPGKEIEEKLQEMEQPGYKIGQSLIGDIFQHKKIIHDNETPSYVEYSQAYGGELPSKTVHHYLGVPLIIGDEVLGVIRVINKRATTYSIDNKNFELSANGFVEEDVELMQTIATQIAFAIRSAKLIEVQRQYRELIENSPDPIIVVNKEGNITVFNNASENLYGIKAEEVIGQSITNYYTSEAQAKEIGKMLRTSKDNRVQNYPTTIKIKAGSKEEIVPVSLSASGLFDKEGKIIGSIGIFKDIREIYRLQEEKTNAEKLATLGKLAHTVGHEIKHDIATALNYIDVLAYENTGDEELTEIYRDIQESLTEAVDKFQNMLMVGRPKPPEKEIIGVNDIFHKVEETMRRRAEAKEIEFLINYPDEEYELDVDITQLRQALFNLFDNSIDAIEIKKYRKAINEKGRIELSVQDSNGDLQITWKDNGCGILRQNISNVFTPFVTDKPTGNGLGLFIVKSIIENHGGNISVESEEGIGTCFKIFLPLLWKNDS